MIRSAPVDHRLRTRRPAAAPDPASGVPTLARGLLRGLLLATLLAPAGARGDPAAPVAAAQRGVLSALTIDGQRAAVRWTDGDTFHVDSGPMRGRSVRLADVNALEAYGPVHRIGTSAPAALLDLARASAGVAAGGQWSCTSLSHRDVYGRELVRCPEAAAALVKSGHAMVFAVEGRAEPELLELQREAQAARRGLWAGGVPPRLVSSLHSVDERAVARKGAYDRIVDTATGAARPVKHQRRYEVCQEVCLRDGPLASCMRYVPIQLRYRNRPACLVEPAPASPTGGSATGPVR